MYTYNQRSTFYTIFQNKSLKSFVHPLLSLLVLSGLGTLNKLIPLSFKEVLHLGKAQFSLEVLQYFFRDNKVASQTPRKDECFSDVCLKSLCRFGSLGPSKNTHRKSQRKGAFLVSKPVRVLMSKFLVSSCSVFSKFLVLSFVFRLKDFDTIIRLKF